VNNNNNSTKTKELRNRRDSESSYYNEADLQIQNRNNFMNISEQPSFLE